MKLRNLLKTWTLEGFKASDLMEAEFFSINELSIDPLNSYEYIKRNDPNYSESYSFEDRCGNTIVAAYFDSVGEFKTGYKIDGVKTLIFSPEKLAGTEQEIKPCPDDKKISTIYKILIQEIIPKYVLNKKRGKLFFNPVSQSRKKLVGIIMSKIIKQYPELSNRNGYLIKA